MSEVEAVETIAADNTAGLFFLEENTQAVLLYALEQMRKPYLWRSYPGEDIDQADIEKIEDMADVAAYDVTHMFEQDYPTTFIIWPPMAKSITGGALTIGNLTNQIPLYTVNFTTLALNNRIQFPFFARRGVYDITVRGLRNTASAKVQIFTDENINPMTEVDMYGTNTFNVEWLFGSVPFSNSGQHTLDFLAYAKNAASSNYGMYFTWVRGIWTAEYP